MGRRRKQHRNTGTIGIVIIVLAFVVVMSIQIYRMKVREGEYASREKELMQEYEEETQRASEIDHLEEYMKSSEYIEDVAQSRLGLTYKNEIIFKERKE